MVTRLEIDRHEVVLGGKAFGDAGAYEKIISNMQEIKARKGIVIAVISEGDEVITQMADDVMIVPDADEIVAPMLSVIPLQLLSYYIGLAKGLDVDKPRNLAKSVTVE